MSALPGTPGQAIAWLKGQHQHPDKGYKGLCAHLAARAAGYDASGANASPWGRTIPAHKRQTGRAPWGALHFWVTNGYGHVAWGLGDSKVLCNNATGAVTVQAESYYAGLGGHFWIHPDHIASDCFKLATGHNPGRWPIAPAPAPKPKPGGWPLRPGDRDPRIVELKAAFKFDSHSPTYGEAFAKRVTRWQRNHPAYGKADALIGPKTFHAITGK